MRRIAISILSLLVVFSAAANGRLPVVNIAAGGVSARAAFGEGVAPSQKKTVSPTRRVVARAAAPVVKTAAQAAPVAQAVPVDMGEQIVASADVLVPLRPSSDLWAQNDTPLRMPNVNEFAVIRSDAALPEESIDAAPRVAAAASKSASPMSEIDAQIARLNELQKRADASVRAMADDVASDDEFAAVRTISSGALRRAVSARTASQPAASPTTKDNVGQRPSRATSQKANPAKQVTPRPAASDAGEVKISRMVVPMDDVADDVVVRSVKKTESPRIAAVRDDMTKMSPAQLRRAFRKTFMSENKHLSTFKMDDGFDVVSDMSSSIEGFTARRDLSESGGIRPLEIKIKFRNDDAALSRDNYNLLTEYAGVVLSNPTRAIQITIPQSATTSTDARKLAARRLAIMEQALRDSGVSVQRIMPVLSNSGQDDFVLRMISLDQYESLSQQKRDIFGDTVGKKKTYRSMSW